MIGSSDEQFWVFLVKNFNLCDGLKGWKCVGWEMITSFREIKQNENSEQLVLQTLSLHCFYTF